MNNSHASIQHWINQPINHLSMTTPSKSKQMVNQLKYSIHQEIPIRNTKETITSKMVVLAINLIPSTLKII
jgi:hypothetical protein